MTRGQGLKRLARTERHRVVVEKMMRVSTKTRQRGPLGGQPTGKVVAYFCPVDDDGVSPTWRTIAVSGAYMLDDCYGASLHARTHCVPSSDLSDSFVQNMRKVTRAMAKCMLKDPRRRFTYGYTIEYSEMRLWYCDRANIVILQAFDFTSVSRPFLARDV